MRTAEIFYVEDETGIIATTLPVYCIYYGNEGASSSFSDVYRHVIIRNLLHYIFNNLAVLIRRWEIQIYLHRTFLPQGYLHNV
jgi:hypothetical protein